MPYAGIDLAVFETLKNTYSKEKIIPNHIILSFGMISGTCGACLMYPLALLRTRLQAQGTPSHPVYYNSAFDVISRTFKQEGLAGFYKGLAPTLLKVLPAVSISYVVYEQAKRVLNVQ